MFFIYNNFKLIIIVNDQVVDDRKDFINTMEKLSLYAAGSYFIHLYDKIQGVYGCSQIKLEKMIILAQVEYYLKNKQELMNGLDIIFAEECGFSLDTKNVFFRSPISVSKEYKNSKLSPELIEKIYVYKDSDIMYFDENDICPKAKELLNSIFENYASCTPRKLGEYLDNIKCCKTFQDLSKANQKHFQISSDDFYKMIEESNFGNIQFTYE